ncbi:unnamed protein product [Rotaria sp. Silwood1]|nr:unnamed protein product [Rotaria sp. Silwood1]CAF0909217.1 unnamed protein product [Rotaria sp. Silwood1]CAF3352409.1 unnamed protein product [Rotaria sp. Silwood1]CAF3375608.1 unnamed protein product [Rotaria sp. Silwood1]CAF4687025.1 unnamed protein product [Rotaria sp. Silwood1]
MMLKSLETALICSISLQLCDEPILPEDDHIYERTAITEEINLNGKGRLTRALLIIDPLYPNFITKKGIVSTLITVLEILQNSSPAAHIEKPDMHSMGMPIIEVYNQETSNVSVTCISSRTNAANGQPSDVRQVMLVSNQAKSLEKIETSIILSISCIQVSDNG